MGEGYPDSIGADAFGGVGGSGRSMRPVKLVRPISGINTEEESS